MKVSMEIRKDGLIVINDKGNCYNENGELVNIYIGEEVGRE